MEGSTSPPFFFPNGGGRRAEDPTSPPLFFPEGEGRVEGSTSPPIPPSSITSLFPFPSRGSFLGVEGGNDPADSNNLSFCEISLSRTSSICWRRKGPTSWSYPWLVLESTGADTGSRYSPAPPGVATAPSEGLYFHPVGRGSSFPSSPSSLPPGRLGAFPFPGSFQSGNFWNAPPPR